jgi:hypothetical protein
MLLKWNNTKLIRWIQTPVTQRGELANKKKRIFSALHEVTGYKPVKSKNSPQ